MALPSRDPCPSEFGPRNALEPSSAREEIRRRVIKVGLAWEGEYRSIIPLLQHPKGTLEVD